MKEYESIGCAEEVWQCLTRRCLPLKFAYCGSACATHLRLADSGEYAAVTLGTTAESVALTEAIGDGDIHLCDIGPGNGRHSIGIFGGLADAARVPRRALLLDMSTELLNIASSAYTTRFPSLHLTWQIWDFESGPTRHIANWRSPNQPVLAALLGQTIGNAVDPTAVLQSIHGSLQPHDRLVLSVTLLDPRGPEAMLDPYRTEVFAAAAMQPLAMAGISAERGQLDLAFDSQRSAVVGRFVFAAPFALTFRGRTLTFRHGDTIECFQSRRFTKASLCALFSHDMWTTSCHLDTNGRHAAIHAEHRGGGK